MANITLRILLIDDDPSLLNLYREILETAGYDVDTASTAEETLLLLESPVPPALVLVDCCMPHVDGAALIDLLKARHPALLEGVPFIGMSGVGPGGSLTRECEKRVVEFTEKPDDIDSLVELVTRFARPAPASALGE